MGGKLREISKEELGRILVDHKVWLESDGKIGKRADLSGANLSRADLSGVELSEADLSGSDLSWSDLSGADLNRAGLSWAYLNGTDLNGADLSGAELCGAYLRMAILSVSILSGADLSGADLSVANLVGAILFKADLSGADLSAANLVGANLVGANLRGANLTGADLTGASLGMEYLGGSDFADAFFYKTKATNRAQLASAKNIEDYSGFIFNEEDEERTRQQGRERDSAARAKFDVDQKGEITLSLPDTYGPAQIGRVLYLISLLYEGTRFALLSPFEQMDDLFRQAMAPELYEAQRDEYSLKLVSAQPGSWVLAVQGVLAILQIIQAMPQVIKDWREKKTEEERALQRIEVAEKAAQYSENRQNALINQGRELTALACAPGMPQDLTDDIYRVVKTKIGELDRSNERINIAQQVHGYAVTNIMAIRGKLGGEFKILGHDLLPDKLYSEDYPEAENEQNPTGKPEE